MSTNSIMWQSLLQNMNYKTRLKDQLDIKINSDIKLKKYMKL